MKKRTLTILLLATMFLIAAHAKWERHSVEAAALLNYLEENVGKKMLTGTMANVNYNTYEADWVYKHTGKYPALNCFDYIHAPFSTAGGWIDYGNPSVVLDWSNGGGIVAAMWHWNMPANNGTGWSFYCGTDPEQTSFSPSDILDASSEGYARMINDIDKVAEWMKPIAERGIPIVWRPLHEAQGNWSEQYPGIGWHTSWFWWGANGPTVFVALWRTMYDRMVNYHGLTNLVWVFTAGDPKRWYPGDEYVDMVGYDAYNKDINGMKDLYNTMKSLYPGKLLALTECGNVPKVSEQWAEKLYWSFFMPWYDYYRTNKPDAEEYNSTEHNYCNIDFWQDALECDFIITRNELPNFTSGIMPVRAMQSGSNGAANGTTWYNMKGQPAAVLPNNPTSKGIYILNGKKHIVK